MELEQKIEMMYKNSKFILISLGIMTLILLGLFWSQELRMDRLSEAIVFINDDSLNTLQDNVVSVNDNIMVTNDNIAILQDNLLSRLNCTG